MSGGFDKKGYWESKILRWEAARYGALSWLRPGSWTLRRRMNAAAELVKRHVPPRARVLELGCGSGLLAERIVGHCDSFLGIDLADAAITRARERLPDARAQFRRGNVLEEELPPADLTVFLGLVDWLDDGEAAALFRRLRSRFLLFSFTEANAWRGFGLYSLYRRFHDARYGKSVYGARSYRRADLERWLAPLGKARITVHPTLFFDPGRIVLVELPAPRG